MVKFLLPRLRSMLAQFLLCILSALCREYKFVALLERDGALKSTKQINSHFEYVRKYFPQKFAGSLTETWNFNVFMYLDGKDLAAYGAASVVNGVKNIRSRIPFVGGKTRVPFVSLFSLLVVEKYRGRGMCEGLVKDIVGSLKKSHNLPSDTLVALHISPKDPMMHISARIYYRMGFTKGAFSPVGPSQFQYRLDYLLENSYDLYKIMNEPEALKQHGNFIVLYCRLTDLGKFNEPPADSMEMGKALVDFLNNRPKTP